MTRQLFKFVHPSWHKLLHEAIALVADDYLEQCLTSTTFLPGPERMFRAFSRPQALARYVLLGESPYPRQASANGYAFWDAAVAGLWSPQGLSKSVNRATSLRNFLKMLLHAEGVLASPFQAQAIASLEKSHYIQTLDQLFEELLHQGFLLLNASLVWSCDQPVSYHAKHWYAFNRYILDKLGQGSIQKFLLFGKIAQKFNFLPPEKILCAEHPYVLSFIENQDVLTFFQPFHFLRASNVK